MICKNYSVLHASKVSWLYVTCKSVSGVHENSKLGYTTTPRDGRVFSAQTKPVKST